MFEEGGGGVKKKEKNKKWWRRRRKKKEEENNNKKNLIKLVLTYVSASTPVPIAPISRPLISIIRA